MIDRKAGTYNYDEALRTEAVALVIDEKMSVSKASKQVGVSYEPLRKWIKESGCTREGEESKNERYHRSMKNVILSENYFQPEDLERAIGQWAEHYNIKRNHEALDNLRPADVYSGRDAKILKKRSDSPNQRRNTLHLFTNCR